MVPAVGNEIRGQLAPEHSVYPERMQDVLSLAEVSRRQQEVS